MKLDCSDCEWVRNWSELDFPKLSKDEGIKLFLSQTAWVQLTPQRLLHKPWSEAVMEMFNVLSTSLIILHLL